MTGRRFVILTVVVFMVTLGGYVNAQETLPDLSGLLPSDGEVMGLKLEEPPKIFTGDELFIMIDGGADVYHEYGFSRVIAANYIGSSGLPLKLEIYEMATSDAAYGIFTFKIGETGTHLAIGQGAVFEDYYLNFWKGRFLVTIVGLHSNEKTRQNIIAMAKAVDNRIKQTAKLPALAQLFVRPPVTFSHPRYIRGLLGIMNIYMFDTRNVFHVREGMSGMVNGCRAFVFQYPDGIQSNAAFEQATGHFKAGKRFTNQIRKDTVYRMSGRDGEGIVIQEASPYIVVAIDPDNDSDKTMDVTERLVLKLSDQTKEETH